MKNATARYTGGIFVLFALGIGGEYATSRSDWGATGELVRGLSEALLVSGVLALIVDPVLKRRMQDESGWGALFGYLNPDAPASLRDAVGELAKISRYSKSCSWTIDFSWFDESRQVLAVTLDVVNSEVNLDKNPYRPTGKPWVLASTHGFQTEYLQYSLSCPGHFAPLDADRTTLSPVVVTNGDGSIYIDLIRLVGNRTVPPGATYDTRKRARMYRHVSGYVPLHHGIFIESLNMKLSGSALSDLDVTISHPKQKGRRLPSEWKHRGKEQGSADSRNFGRATPGQLTLVSWGFARDI
ncbi:hypothetical protein SAMN05216251_13338 [Actinacidiphila alni]|uniref:Uncharacterized protein n=1 Tax=Actinacidiphila alni TaxID=380248 RepID=A0A1I2M8B7_9ACTN|nr:hypothetical protein [Actinacidiphila alni]SFF87120.1 hypothetical protein SAMN05216251_13338 [Actinacidiphila alni]